MTPSPAEIDDLLAEAPHLYLGLSLDSGPHITPELFTRDGDRLICLVAATTLKARSMADRPEVALVAQVGGRAVIGAGLATVIDPGSPRSLARAPVRAASGPLDAARFVAGNAGELTGAVLDYFAGRLGGAVPPHRVVISVEPTTMEAVVSGPEPARSSGSTSGSGIPGLELVPAHLAALVEGPGAVVGWTNGDGSTVAFPARWDAEAGEATVAADLFDTVGGVRDSPACATFDTWTGLGPSGKQGLMLRGRGRARTRAGAVRLTFTFDRATHWDGITTDTEALQ